MSPPLVSIIVPCFARTGKDVELLDETLGTVSQQSVRDYELLVVDDGSPRDVAPVIATYQRTVLIRRINGGSAAARNSGIRAARGQFVVFLDADDHLLPCALEEGVRHLREHPSCGWTVGPREEMTFAGDPVPWTVSPPPHADDMYVALLGFDWYIIPPSAAMFRRSLVDALGGFQDPWGADDLDFYLRAATIQRAWCYPSPPVTRYRRYSASSSRNGERMLRSIRVVYERQRRIVRDDPRRRAAFETGLARLTGIFRDCLVENLDDAVRGRQWRPAIRAAAMLARESPRRLSQYLRSATADATSGEES